MTWHIFCGKDNFSICFFGFLIRLISDWVNEFSLITNRPFVCLVAELIQKNEIYVIKKIYSNK